MVAQASFFDMAAPSIVVRTSAPTPQCRRIVTAKPGTFFDVKDGVKAHEFRFVELTDGSIFKEYEDGERASAPRWVTRIFLDDAVRYGTALEVER